MTELLDQDWQRNIASTTENHVAQMCHAIAGQATLPSVLYRPSLTIDGDRWCALYGSNLQDGVAGFGDSPDAAMWDFNRAWSVKLATHQKDKP
jgi:hypothetical protein